MTAQTDVGVTYDPLIVEGDLSVAWSATISSIWEIFSCKGSN